MYKAFTKHRRLNNDVMICFVKYIRTRGEQNQD